MAGREPKEENMKESTQSEKIESATSEDILKISHDELTSLGAKWLQSHPQNMIVPNCSTIVKELITATETGEIPDILGWCSWASVLIETKISRADFLKDLKKPFRKTPGLGMGEFRYYLSPEGLIKENEVPSSWGLLYYINGQIEIIKNAERLNSNLECERTVLLSILRRKKLVIQTQ